VKQNGKMLADIAGELRAAHQRSETVLIWKGTAIELGKLLLEARRLIGSKGWLTWLAENTKISARTAQNYMRLAQAG